MPEKGRVFVVAGPSGAGKGTLIRLALEKAGNIHYSISVTTRPPGAGEVDGKDYHFISDERFDALVRQDALLEWEEVYGRRYGTLKSEVEKARNEGKDVLLELDVKGALNVRTRLEDALLVFIMPPSLEELESRLMKRDRDGHEDIGARLKEAEKEMEAGRTAFDVVIENIDIDEAAARLSVIIREETG